MTTQIEMEAVREKIQQLADQNQGRVEPETVVNEARSKRSPLHSHFTWDDTEAAQKQRLHEARVLIRSVRIEVVVNETTVRRIGYVRDPRKPTHEQGYVSVAKIKTSKELAREVLVEEFGRAAAALRRAVEVAKALSLEEDVKTHLKGLEKFRERLETLDAIN
jgi:flagellar basal body rod protein FlgC